MLIGYNVRFNWKGKGLNSSHRTGQNNNNRTKYKDIQKKRSNDSCNIPFWGAVCLVSQSLLSSQWPLSHARARSNNGQDMMKISLHFRLFHIFLKCTHEAEESYNRKTNNCKAVLVSNKMKSKKHAGNQNQCNCLVFWLANSSWLEIYHAILKNERNRKYGVDELCEC